MSLSIAGKTAIVTGAANGVGLAIARHFVAQGANVMFADRDEARLEAEIGDATGGEGPGPRAFAGDLRERLTVANLLSATLDAFDRVDILVNATRQIVVTDPLDAEDTSVPDLLEQNLMTALRLSQAVAKRMIHQAKDDDGTGTIGTIVNIGSIAGRRTQPELLAYSVSAAALDQATRSLAVSLAAKRIRVNGLSVGSVMSANLKTRLKEDGDLREAIVRATPMGRIAAPSELAETVQYLASDAIGLHDRANPDDRRGAHADRPRGGADALSGGAGRSFTNVAALEALYGTPGRASLDKVANRLTPLYRRLDHGRALRHPVDRRPRGHGCQPARRRWPGGVRVWRRTGSPCPTGAGTTGWTRCATSFATRAFRCSSWCRARATWSA